MSQKGGSAQLVPKRKRQSKTVRNVNAEKRVLAKIGAEKMEEIQRDWASKDTAWGGRDYYIAQGVIISLLQMNFKQLEICIMLRCGNGRVSALNKLLKTGNWQLSPKLRPPPLHALTEEERDFIRAEKEYWELEDGFPCSHRRPRQYLAKENTTWVKLHEIYAERMRAGGHRVVSYERWTQYVHFYFPGLRLNRTTTDDCDACIRLKIELKMPNLEPARKAELELELATHLGVAIQQRRLMSKFVKGYVANIDPAQLFPTEDVLDDTVEDLAGLVDQQLLIDAVERGRTVGAKVLVQAEDFGGSIALPHYGFSRPQADYFNSNLMEHPFVTTNINDNVNYVWFFDERAQDKGADCLCSLRTRYHLMQLDRYADCVFQPRVSVSIMDNCVGQNKSQVVMKFFAMLSVLLYEKVVLLYLLPGHSHMKPDRVVAWVKGAIKGLNLYTPQQIVEKCNTVNSIEAEFLDHNSPNRPFFVGWEAVLNKYFRNMPAGFISFYFFEMDRGTVTYRHTGDSLDAEASVHSLLRADYTVVKKALFQELFGVTSVSELSAASINSLKLPRHKGNTLTKKKVKSLSKKYFSIPPQYRPYYPTVDSGVGDVESTDEGSSDDGDDDSDDTDDGEDAPVTRPAPPLHARAAPTPATPAKPKKSDVAPGARKPGRPRTIKPTTPNGQRSILTYLTPPTATPATPAPTPASTPAPNA